MATKDKLLYFDVRARAEPIRMLYALAGKSLDDKRVGLGEWPSWKGDQPLGQLPVYECEEGTLLMSNTIARFVAKKFGLAGSCLWEEALNDLVQELIIDIIVQIKTKIYTWMVLKRVPEPENAEQVKEELKAKIVKGLAYIQSVAEKRGKKFIVGDEICLADIQVFAALEYGSVAFPDLMEINPWVKQFVAKVRENEKMNKYLEERPPSVRGI